MAGPLPRLARLAADHDITPTAAEQAARMAQAILAGEGAWAWDAALIQTAINEAPLHYQGQSLRIDRLVQCRAVQADDALAGWWVLDYKSATQPQRQQALVAQLQRYREAVSVLMPGEVVHAVFLTGDGRMVMVGGADASAATWGILPPPALRRWMCPRCPQRLPLVLVPPKLHQRCPIPGRVPCSDPRIRSRHLLDVDPKASRVPSPILRPRHFCRFRDLLRCGHHWRWPRRAHGGKSAGPKRRGRASV